MPNAKRQNARFLTLSKHSFNAYHDLSQTLQKWEFCTLDMTWI